MGSTPAGCRPFPTKLANFEVVHALNSAGGVAVNAHGYLRFTRNGGLVVRPVSAEEFANATLRESWRREKGMLVLKMWSDAHRETPLDIFVYEPFDFEAEYNRALLKGQKPAFRFLIERPFIGDSISNSHGR